MNDEVCVEYATKEEALEELDYLHEDEDFEYLIDIQTVYKLTQEGLCHVNATKFSQFNTDLLLIKYLEELTRDENIHGVYLEDDFEPQNYSLPRGGIFQSKLKTFP